jgi:magnesium chelatase family protein
VVPQRIAAARERAAARLDGTPWLLNAEVPATVLRYSFPPRPEALTSLDRAMGLGQVSTRGADKIIRVAWSLADLAAKDRPGAPKIFC